MGDLVRLSQKRQERAASPAKTAKQRLRLAVRSHLDATDPHHSEKHRCACGGQRWEIWHGGAVQCIDCESFAKDMICIEHGGKVT